MRKDYVNQFSTIHDLIVMNIHLLFVIVLAIFKKCSPIAS